MKRWLRRTGAGLRARAPFAAPIVLALVISAAVVPQAHSLWFQTLSSNITVTTGKFATPTYTATPYATSTPCKDDSEEHDLHFDGNVFVKGYGPLSAVITAENHAGTTAHGVVLGFAASEGSEYVSRVDFGNGQDWLVRGQPDATLYDVGDLPPGGQSRVQLTVQTTKAWDDAPADTRVLIHAGFTHSDCSSDGQSDKATISLAPAVLATPTPSLTPAPAATATATPTVPAIVTATPTLTPTAGPTLTATATSEATATPTATASPGG